VKILDGQKGKRCDVATYLSFTHKRCSSCGAVKEVGLFYRKNTRTARGWSWDSHCIECRREACRDYGSVSKDARNARLRDWRKSNPASAARVDKRKRLKSKYGLSPEQVEQMRADQRGRCGICELSGFSWTTATRKVTFAHCFAKRATHSWAGTKRRPARSFGFRYVEDHRR
jgi:hypothetical protein